MQELDLEQANCNRFSAHVHFHMDPDDLRELISEHLAQEVDNFPYVGGTNYSLGESSVAVITLLTQGEVEEAYNFSVRYEAQSTYESSEQEPPPEDLNRLLSEIDDLEFRVSSIFEYPTDNFTSTLFLPITLTAGQDPTFDEIRGARVAKRTEDEEIEYEVILDMPSTEKLLHTVMFSYAGYLALDDYEEVFSTAVGISEQFIKGIEQ